MATEGAGRTGVLLTLTGLGFFAYGLGHAGIRWTVWAVMCWVLGLVYAFTTNHRRWL